MTDPPCGARFSAARFLRAYFVSAEVYLYGTNILTTYYVATERVITECRFRSLIRQESSPGKGREIEERKTLTEPLGGLRTVQVFDRFELQLVAVVLRRDRFPDRLAVGGLLDVLADRFDEAVG